jgi:hypothetical protein
LSRHQKLHEKPAVPITGNASLTPAVDEHQFSPQVEISNFSPAEQHARPVPVIPGDAFVNNEQQFPSIGNMSLPLWAETDNMLEFLTSDFSTTWPLALPMTQFEPSLFDGVNGSALPLPTDNSQKTNAQGHQAMEQMGRLISVLSSNLTAEIQNTGITSSFLDTCMHVFFDKFAPSFPVLHRATFAVKDSSHPLILNIVALGSLFVGAKDAVAKGEALWRLAHIAVATNWVRLILILICHSFQMGAEILTVLFKGT